MKGLLSLLAAMAFFTSGAFAQDSGENPLAMVVRGYGKVDPFLQAIYQDHMDVALDVFTRAQNEKLDAQRKTLAAVITAFGAPVLSRAGDSAVISVLHKTAALADIVAEKYPEGCQYFFTGSMPDWYSIPEVRNGRMADLRAKTYAYEDGKFRAPVVLMSSDKEYLIMTQYLKMTAEEVRKAVDAPAGVNNEEMCSIARKLNNVDALPKELQGDWGRVLLARGLSVRDPYKAAVKPDAKEEDIEAGIKALAEASPDLAAVLADHVDETRQIYSTFKRTGDQNELREALTVMVKTHGNPARARATDRYAIDVLNKTAVFVDVLADLYPQGCNEFAYSNMSPKALSIPQVKESYLDYLEAMRLAYEDGKSRPPVAALSRQEASYLITENLGLTVDEVRLIQKPGLASTEQVCSLLKKLNRIDLVPAVQRGAWARANISKR